MQKNSNLISKVALTTLLLVSVFSFSNCAKDDAISLMPNENGLLSEKELSASTASVKKPVTLDAAKFRSDGGYAYKISEKVADGDNSEAPQKSILKFYENGVELGAAHSVHNDIRKQGKGRFSHWGSTIIFSTSDNSDPRTNGRVYSYSLGSVEQTISSKPAAPTTSNTSSTNMNSGLMGYAMVNGTTTGGQGGQEVTVTTLAALRSALSDSKPKIVYISGTIKGKGEDPIYVKSNKSIIGKSGARIDGAQFYVFNVRNVIIQNITFRNYVHSAAVQIKDKAHHIWVDHCDFSTDKTRGWEYWGKDISITRESDYVTVSWNKFHGTNKSVLISGGIKGHEADKGKLRVTMHHNFWYDVSEREPSMNYGRVHMFNNYHLNNAGYSIGTRAGGIVRTDNEYFKNCKVPLSSKVAKDPEGYFSGVNTNIYDKSGANKITTPISNWVPEYEYKSYLHAAADVPTIVSNGAGTR